MDLLSRFALADIQMAQRLREEHTLTLRHEAAERRRANAVRAVRAPRAPRLSLPDRFAAVFGRTTDPALCPCT
jgi:alpha-D-ribose 1-methylphosphonate 5-triphosphate diphosphatase PhnM